MPDDPFAACLALRLARGEFGRERGQTPDLGILFRDDLGEIVERALELFGAPIYVRHEVVHNRFVVESLRHRGAIFVDRLDDVPDDQTVIFSAHGVAQRVKQEAEERGRDSRVPSSAALLAGGFLGDFIKGLFFHCQALLINVFARKQFIPIIGFYSILISIC